MNFNDLPLLATLKNRLDYLNERQSLIAQNVSNADTPGYEPSDLAPFTIPGANDQLQLSPVAPVATAPIPATTTAPAIPLAASTAASDPWRPNKAPDSETRLDGNQVVLEEQMMKMNDARMNYNAAINFYEQSMSMIQTAIRIPGK